MSPLKRCRHISNLKCAKLIRVEDSVRKGIRVTFDHWFNCLLSAIVCLMISTSWTSYYKYDHVTNKKKYEIRQVAHSAGAAAPASRSDVNIMEVWATSNTAFLRYFGMKFLWLETQYNLDNLDVRQLRKRRAFEMAIAEMINLRHHYKSHKDYVMNFLNECYRAVP